MEWLQSVWGIISISLGGLTIGGIITAIVTGILRGSVSKVINKVNVEKISESAVEKGIDEIKHISFTQSIQPIVESGLEKITEKANAYIASYLSKVDEKYDKLINVLSKLAAYFDDSIGVPESAKKELKKALQQAVEEKPQEQVIVIESEPVKVEAEKVEEEIKKENKKASR